MGERPLPAGFIPDGFQPDTATPAAGGGTTGFAEEFWKRANPLDWASGLVEAAKHPVDTALGVVRADPAFLDQAKAAAQQGDYATAARKVLSFLSMGMGHELDTQANLLQQGQYARGAGAMAGTATQFLAPDAAAAGLTAAAPRVAAVTRMTPAIADAVQFGKIHGVPLDAATATDNAAIRGIQHLSDRTIGGAGVAGRASQAQQTGLATLGEQLASKGYATPTTAEAAGAATRQALAGRVADFSTAADTAYTRLRAMELVRPIPVDLTGLKASIEPVYATLSQGADVAPLQGTRATAVRAMARVLNGPDVVDASVADSALSDLKALQRDAKGTPGAGPITQMVTKADQAVLQAVSRSGPDALKALQEGRTATRAKYAAQDVLDSLDTEPVKVTQGLTRPRDTAIAQLRTVAAQTPNLMPQIGRSVLDGLLERATESGGFAHADQLYADWQKLGDQTKATLFKDPQYIKDLDNFFLLAKQMAKNANPSGTAHAVAIAAQGGDLLYSLFHGDVAGLGAGGASVGLSASLSALLHSDAGVRLLTEGLKLPAAAGPRAGWLARVRRLAGAQGLVLNAAPAGGSQ